MSLITCCPACQTMFQVSGEDLRVSDGWVRCGHCDGVFDASAHLQVVPVQSEAFASSEPGPLTAPDRPLDNSLESSGAWPASGAQSSSPQAAQGTPGRSDQAAPAYSAAPALDTALPDPEPIGFFRSVTSGDSTSSATSQDASARPEWLSESAVPSTSVLRQEDLSARQDGRALEYLPSRTPRRSARRVWVWGCVLLLLAAAVLGWLRHERQALVQRMPSLLGAVEQLCQLSACEVQAPRLLQAILIEGAVLEEAGPAQYKVQLILRNNGPVALAMPALDVSLTGLQGEVLVRHTVLPAEFAPGISRLWPDAQQSVSFTVPGIPQLQATAPPVATANPAASAIATSAGAQASPALASASAPASPVAPAAEPAPAPSISGYRVIAFYP